MSTTVTIRGNPGALMSELMSSFVLTEIPETVVLTSWNYASVIRP